MLYFFIEFLILINKGRAKLSPYRIALCKRSFLMWRQIQDLPRIDTIGVR